MCGIAGIYNYGDAERPVDRELVVRMTRCLAHRGPDGEGFHFEKNVGLGHRRLAIVDLTVTGAQPMATNDGRAWITYNGEFYNHREYRARLGGSFDGTSDTETLLRLLDQDGPDALAGISGIFAFAYWDGRRQALTLARDQMGVKQVYYHDNGRRIIFASEIKALLEDPEVPREPDPEAVNQYLHFHTPLFERTFFRHVKVLRAGEYMRVTRYGAIFRKYWSISDFRHEPTSEKEMVKRLESKLDTVVSRQLMADVPVGAFFSGGIDSSAIAATVAKTGRHPICFGVHFSDQGVTDERPYQEAAAKALGLDLQLITMDGSGFPEEFQRLMYHQDQPVIGQAMFPMAKVSRLAASQVKVCLGGQAADEIFGGYARYALASPMHFLSSWFKGRNERRDSPGGGKHVVGGNLTRQFAQSKTLLRLARNIRYLANWETGYFEHFAKEPEDTWLRLLAAREFCSRDQCRQIYHETIMRSEAKDPLDKILHWDTQTYLAGLFQQDDRMSMAASLESRVPFADPELVRFAFHVSPDLKLRSGASKWILRQAVADVLPSLVLNRKKVGFDTPAQRWITELHFDWTRDTILSARSRARGFWNVNELERLLEGARAGRQFDVLWKVLAIEVWASVFLDGTAPKATLQPRPIEVSTQKAEIRHLVREVRELGVKGTMARGLWEVKTRSGLARLQSAGDAPAVTSIESQVVDRAQLPFENPSRVREAMQGLLDTETLGRLAHEASEATRGRILCFSGWVADYGIPIDWHRDPIDGHRYLADAHWSGALRNARKSDVKFVWEAARFPHAYSMARAAAFCPESAGDLATALAGQVTDFAQRNPPGTGVHWLSGQELALRLLSWLFALHVLGDQMGRDALEAISQSLASGGSHLMAHLAYARDSVYNNHLLSEALGLLIAGQLTHGAAAGKWSAEGLRHLIEQANRQVYEDGGYIQQSHNYHRVAMQLYLWATAFVTRNGGQIPAEWTNAMERSLDFMLAHQNPRNGWLPNYGANDGSLPLRITSCDIPDFRPVLQALSIATRGERLYDRGPWDEAAIWLLGAQTMDTPLRRPQSRSVSFPVTGYHVLRGTNGDSFCAFRCGTLRDRFSQIDMLHVDVWWRGLNVLADGGTYRYNGAPEWHSHFLRTASHNTISLDGRDQMVHVRQFKTLYRTEAQLLRFEDGAEAALVEGEHYGYRRELQCTHRRAVLFAKDDFWIVADTIAADTIAGTRAHTARLHWLGGSFPFRFDEVKAQLALDTPEGLFTVTVLDAQGLPCAADVVAGAEDPPRGWLSRTYGEKAPAPSLAVTLVGGVPLAFVSVLCAGKPVVVVDGAEWSVTANERTVRFRLENGSFADVVSAPAELRV